MACRGGAACGPRGLPRRSPLELRRRLGVVLQRLLGERREALLKRLGLLFVLCALRWGRVWHFSGMIRVRGAAAVPHDYRPQHAAAAEQQRQSARSDNRGCNSGVASKARRCAPQRTAAAAFGAPTRAKTAKRTWSTWPFWLPLATRTRVWRRVTPVCNRLRPPKRGIEWSGHGGRAGEQDPLCRPAHITTASTLLPLADTHPSASIGKL